jgi:hypothetical protein
MNQLAARIASRAPTLVAAAGARASYRFLEFFTAQIRNPHTAAPMRERRREFFAWLEAKGVMQITAIEPRPADQKRAGLRRMDKGQSGVPVMTHGG